MLPDIEQTELVDDALKRKLFVFCAEEMKIGTPGQVPTWSSNRGRRRSPNTIGFKSLYIDLRELSGFS